MNETVKLILSLSLSGSILAGLLLAVKLLINNRVSKAFQYYIWLLVLLRLVLPFSFEESLMNRAFYPAEPPVTISSSAVVNENQGNTSLSTDLSVTRKVETGAYNNDSDHTRYFNDLLSQVAFYVWLLGILLSWGFYFGGYSRFVSLLRPSNIPAAPGEQALLDRLAGDNSKVKLFRNRFATTPVLVGILAPRIIIPDKEYAPQQLEYILRHELTHLRRFDVGYKWFTVLVTSLHWFNPLMIFIRREINRACELSCDEAVIKNLSAADKQAYGETLISVVAEHRCPIGVLSTTMCEEKRTLKERLVSIMGSGRRSVIVAVIVLACMILGAAWLGVSAPGHSEINITNVARVSWVAEQSENKETQIVDEHEWGPIIKLINNAKRSPLPEQDWPSLEPDGQYPVHFRLTVTMKRQQSVENAEYALWLYQKGGDPRNGAYQYGLALTCLSEEGEADVWALSDRDCRWVKDWFGARVGLDTMYIGGVTGPTGIKVSSKLGSATSAGGYNLAEIAKHKTPYVGDPSKAGAIIGRLPVPDTYFIQHYMFLRTAEKPYGLTAYYEPADDGKNNEALPAITSDPKIMATLQKNALVLFCMIDNVDDVTFAFSPTPSAGELNTTDYSIEISFSRSDIERVYGDLAVLARDLNLLEQALIKEVTVAATVTEPVDDSPLPEFAEAEVAAARAVVEEYYRAVAAKDAEAILATLYPREHRTLENVKSGHVQLYGTENRTLLTIDYDSQDPMRRHYRPIHPITADNIIVFKVSFNIEYPLKDGGPWNEGVYENWSMILIRDDKNSPWLIYDQGY
jgi:beta-lactamase regulating signal transducer with metallopeptidase domain